MMHPIRSFRALAKPMRSALVLGVVLALLASACLVQLGVLQLVEGARTAQAAAQARTVQVTLSAKRGRIMDTNGVVLAQSVERYTIVGNPQAAQDFTPLDCTPRTQHNCQHLDGKPL